MARRGRKRDGASGDASGRKRDRGIVRATRVSIASRNERHEGLVRNAKSAGRREGAEGGTRRVKEVRSEEGEREGERARERDAARRRYTFTYTYVCFHPPRSPLPSPPSSTPLPLSPPAPDPPPRSLASRVVAPSLSLLPVLLSFVSFSLFSTHTSAFGLSRSFRPRISRAWRFTLNAGPFPSAVSREHARVLVVWGRRPHGGRWREGEKGLLSFSRVSRGVEGKIVRKYSSARGERRFGHVPACT